MSSELTAQDLMQSEVRSVSSAMPVIELEHLLIRDGLGGVAVIDDGKLVGIISRSDILRYTLCGVITTMDMTRLLADGRAVAKSG